MKSYRQSPAIEINLSIITPVYYGARFIEACLQNVIGQACPEAEHVIVDGGSVDGTVDVIRQYATRYPHIRWISEKDCGQSVAMNKGITMARGEIIGILNVDDFYQPGVLNRVIEIFKDLPEPSLAVGNCSVWDDSGQLILINRPIKLSLADLLLGSRINPMPLNPSAYFYHKSIHQLVGLYDSNEDFIMDWDFLFRAIQVATVKYFDEVWGNFRMLSASKTTQDMARGISSQRQVRILKKYRQALPPYLRLRVAIIYFLRHDILGTVRYFFEHPDELPWRFKSRITRILRMNKEATIEEKDMVG